MVNMGKKGKNCGDTETPLGIYVHTPFCASKCGYCDFYSVPLEQQTAGNLIQRVRRELESRVTDAQSAIRTVFCGGGTPTILPLAPLAKLLEELTRIARRHAVAEFSVEANPGTVDDDRAKLLSESGVNRVSLGAQSFRAQELAVLERRHVADDVAVSVERLRRHNIGQISLDLIFGIPGQTLDTWSESLRRAIELQPDHIACYGLTYEPGTRLFEQREHGVVTACDEELEADMYCYAIDTLAAAGYQQYEISNFARPGCQCLHNLAYWHNEPYIGVGPSAAGYLDGRRYKNVSDVEAYICMIDKQGHAEQESEMIDPPKLMTEMIMMQLRLVEGLSIADFHRRTGADPVALFGDLLDRLVDKGFATVSATHIALTRQGRLVSNAIMAELTYICDTYGPHTPTETA